MSKRIHPYLFRHSRVTEMLASGKIPESVIKLQMWGTLNTPMLATYGHLSNQQQDAILLAASGRSDGTPVEPIKPSLSDVTCMGCGKVNPPDKTYCEDCTMPLDPVAYQKKLQEGASEIDVLRQRIADMEQTKQEQADAAHDIFAGLDQKQQAFAMEMLQMIRNELMVRGLPEGKGEGK